MRRLTDAVVYMHDNGMHTSMYFGVWTTYVFVSLREFLDDSEVIDACYFKEKLPTTLETSSDSHLCEVCTHLYITHVLYTQIHAHRLAHTITHTHTHTHTHMHTSYRHGTQRSQIRKYTPFNC